MGNTDERRWESGYTLIELVVVVSLLSLMLLFSIPRFEEAVGTGKTKKISRWIMFKAQTLKEKSVRERQDYTLHISLDSGKLWITSGDTSEEAIEEAEESGYPIPEDYRLLDVEYPEKGKISLGRADIRFYKEGYSDKVLIHIEDDDANPFSFLIEPFLPKIKMYEEYVGFES
ncbi:prepilin-type N-terminal cleavage/methylation domain-containing protein [Desulfococcaceae bacterium HSG8]|nr:prepilin-type N-terminal cleavage/methylation domain-containing protein [Desulfococcaceae bacterium HSG8]